MAKTTRSKISKIKIVPGSKGNDDKYKMLNSGNTITVAIPYVTGNNFLHWMADLRDAKRPKSDFDVLTISKQGISKLSFDRLANFLGVSRKSLAEDIFDISVKTFERKEPKEKLDKKTSSHAVEIARVLQHASEVFEDDNKVRRWIHKENRALNNMKPIDLFDTLTGLNLVNDILGRIEEGVYS